MARRKRKRDRATRVRRRYIPQGDGKLRPFGLPAVEAKRLQRAVTRRLQAIDEQDVQRGSSGDRPPVGAVDAVDRLTSQLPGGRYTVVVDAEIKGCVDDSDHDWRMRMWGERLEDGACRRLRRTWLRAGVLETAGQILPPVTGTPQGGILSPSLAHGYLPYALDRWFHHVVKPRGGGEACLIRDAEDCVWACQ